MNKDEEDSDLDEDQIIKLIKNNLKSKKKLEAGCVSTVNDN